MEKFSHHEIELIERRVLNKLLEINHDKSFANMKILNHVNEFKKRIKRLKGSPAPPGHGTRPKAVVTP